MVKQDKVRVALIGIGSWSAVIANAVQRSNKLGLATCYSRTPEKRAAFSRKYGCDQEKSFEDVLKRTDVDGVLLTTPNAVHAEHGGESAALLVARPAAGLRVGFARRGRRRTYVRHRRRRRAVRLEGLVAGCGERE